jgi:hypothetical protein
LLFSKALELSDTVTKFETVKIAIGGSRMYEGWYPDHGLYSIGNGTGTNRKAFF